MGSCLQQIFELTLQLHAIFATYTESQYSGELYNIYHSDSKFIRNVFVKTSNWQNLTRDVHNLIPTLEVRRAIAIESDKYYATFKVGYYTLQDYIMYEYDESYKIIKVNRQNFDRIQYDDSIAHLKTLLTYFGYDTKFNTRYSFKHTSITMNNPIIQFTLRKHETTEILNYLQVGTDRYGHYIWDTLNENTLGLPLRIP